MYEWSARHEVLSQNERVLQSQVARVKLTTEKVFDSDIPITDRIQTLFMEQGIIIAANLMSVYMIFSTIVLVVTGGSKRGGREVGAPPKYKSALSRCLKNQLKRLVQALKRLAYKAVAASLEVWLQQVLVSLLSRQMEFVAEKIGTFTVFVVGLVDTRLIKMVKK